MRALIVASTNIIEVAELRQLATGAYPEDATVSAEVRDLAGGVIGACALVHVAGTSGRATLYRGALSASVPLVAGVIYRLLVTAVDQSGSSRKFAMQAPARDG